MGDSRIQPQHLSGYKLQLSTCAAPSLPVAVLLSCETLPGHVWGPCVLVEVELRAVTTCAPAGASWVLSGVSGFRATQRGRFQAETPLRRCAELDFGFLPVATPAGMHTCYLELKLSIRAAGLVAQSLSCKTLPTELGRLGFCRNWSLEHALPVSPWSCKSSKRGFSQQVRAIPGESNRTKPETPLSRSAELDFDSLSSSSRCSTNLLHPIAHHLSCKTLPETLQKHHGLPEMQLRTLTTRVFSWLQLF